MTKDELQKQNGALGERLDREKRKDDRIRLQFAKAFRWEKTIRQRFGNDEVEAYEPSWEEIFVKLGKLLEGQKRLTYVEDMENYRLEQKQQGNDIEELKHRLENCENQ